MLYFSKLRIISVIVFTVIFSYFAFSNFVKFDDKFFSKNINLGLDLQGGSYLLLEIDNDPVITQRLQNKLSSLRKYFKDESIGFKNLKINNDLISFELDQMFVENFVSVLKDKDSEINPYYQRFKSHEYDYEVLNNSFILRYSK